MNNRDSSLVYVLAFTLLGAAVSYCQGGEDLTFLPRLLAVELDPSEDVTNLEGERYSSKSEAAGEEGIGDDEEVSRTKRNAAPKSSEGESASEPRTVYQKPEEEEEEEDGWDRREKRATWKGEDLGFKSRPGFRSWGGKRGTEEEVDGKRAKFATWGGKRAKFATWGGKRTKFATWGGKRAKFATWGGKRAKFNNWGGKRNFGSIPADPGSHGSGNEVRDPPDARYDAKRDRYRVWARAQGAGFAVPTSSTGSDMLSRFNNWGGKRSRSSGRQDSDGPTPYDGFGETDGPPPEGAPSKRGEFESWGGKRDSDSDGFFKSGGKRTFSSWAGKRSDESPPSGYLLSNYIGAHSRDNEFRIGKRDDETLGTSSDEQNKAQFYPWKGKR